MPTLTFAAILLAVFINRLTEMVKSALSTSPHFNGVTDAQWKLLILLISGLLGIAGMLWVFPSANLIPGLGASTTAELIVSGIIVAGAANGIDFLSGKLDLIGIGDNTQPPPVASSNTTVNVAPPAPPAA